MEKEAKRTMVNLEDLPESCLSTIFRRTSPRDICRLSALSRALKSAGNVDFVWEGMLPPAYLQLLQRTDRPLEFSSKKELYFKLCHPIFIDDGTKKFWLDKATGKICFMLSARALAITWGHDDRCWRWIARGDSSFQETAHLIRVRWLEIFGKFDSKLLSRGIAYTVSFVLKLEKGHFRWDEPVKFHTTICGQRQEFLQSVRNPERAVDGWMEFDAGEFVVDESFVVTAERASGYEMSTVRYLVCDGPEFDVEEFVDENGDISIPIFFHMIKLEPFCQGGLCLDGVKIQPTFLIKETTPG